MPKTKTVRFFKILLIGVVLVVFGIVGTVYFLLTSDNEYVPALICQIAKEELDVEMAFSHLTTDRTSNFPYLTLEIEDVYIQGSLYATDNQELMRVNKLSLLFPPWDLVKGKYYIQKVVVDSAKIYFHKDSLGNSNTSFLKKLTTSKKNKQAIEPDKKASKSKIVMNKITFNHVYFDIENEVKDQDFEVEFLEASLNMSQQKDQPRIKLSARCHFDGLYFKKSNGGFLIDKNAQLELKVSMKEEQIVFDNSSINVEGDELKLDGSFTKADTNHLQLNIQTDDILLANVRGLLSSNIQKALNQFEIDQPLKADFKMDGLLIPDHPAAIHIDFETHDAKINFKDIFMSQVQLKGNFSNDCFVTDRIGPGTGCLKIHQLEGNFLDKFPTKLSGSLNDLKQLNNTIAQGQIEVPVIALKDFLGEQAAIEFTKGRANIDFNYKGNPKTLAQKNFANQKRMDMNIQLESLDLQLNESLPIQIQNGQIKVSQHAVELKNINLQLPGVNGQVDAQISDLFPYLANQRKQFKTNLSLDLEKVHVTPLLAALNKINDNDPPVTQQAKDTLIGHQLATVIQQVTDITNANIQLAIQDFKTDKINGQDISLNLQIKNNCAEDSLAENLLNESITCLEVKDLKANFLEGIHAEGDLKIDNMADPRLQLAIVLTAPATQLISILDNPKVSATAGLIELNAFTDVYLNDYQQVNKLLERIIFSSTIQTHNVNATYDQLTIEDFTSKIHLNQDTLLIDTMVFKQAAINPQISGQITNFLPLVFGKEHTAKIDLNMILPSLNIEKIAATNASEKITTNKEPFSPSSLLAQLDSLYHIVDGKINIHIEDLQHLDYPTENISFTLNIEKSCDAKNKEIHCLAIEQFHADIFGDIPVDGQIRIVDLNAPTLSVALHADMPMHDLNRVLYNDNFIAKDGVVELTIDYKIPVDEDLTMKHLLLDSQLDGYIKLEDVSLDYPAQDLQLEAINGSIRFNEKSLDIDTLTLKVNDNWVYANGHTPDFLPFFFNEDKKFHLQIAANSPYFNLSTFSTPGARKEKKEATLEAKINAVDELLAEGKIVFSTNIKKLEYKNFVATNLIGNIHLRHDHITLDQLKMDVASGEFGVHGKITDIAQHQPYLAVDTYFKGTDIHEIFKGFQNFGQKDMTHTNIKGTLFATAIFKAALNDHYEVKPTSIDGDMRIKVSDGELIDFPPLKNMTSFLFKKRHLDDIYFDTLKTHLVFNGLDMTINHFDIHSSAATLSIDGLYSFSDKDKSHIFFEVPLSNLFKPHIESSKIKEHRSKRSGLPILVEAKEKNKKFNFKLRLHKRKHEH